MIHYRFSKNLTSLEKRKVALITSAVFNQFLIFQRWLFMLPELVILSFIWNVVLTFWSTSLPTIILTIEQEIKSLNDASSGIVGITQKEAAFDRHFTCAPRLKNVIDSFNTSFGIDTSSDSHHHELSGSTSARIIKNSRKLEEIFSERDILLTKNWRT